MILMWTGIALAALAFAISTKIETEGSYWTVPAILLLVIACCLYAIGLVQLLTR